MADKNLFDLTGKTALITGGSRGLGLQMAEALGSQGAKVLLSARKTDELQQAQAHLQGLGIEAHFVAGDVAKDDDIAALADAAIDKLGHVDILINNAGTPGVPLPVSETGLSEWRRVFDVNVTGAFLCAREAMPHMASGEWGRVVNVSSAAARHPMAGMAAYGASKAALDQLTRVLALEGEPHNVVVTGVYPGVIDTKMQEESRAFGPDLIGKQLHRMFHGYRDFGMLRPPEEPAELISYLCTPEAGRLNGHVLRLEQLEALKE